MVLSILWGVRQYMKWKVQQAGAKVRRTAGTGGSHHLATGALAGGPTGTTLIGGSMTVLLLSGPRQVPATFIPHLFLGALMALRVFFGL